jgi:hypothetical protein
MSDNYLVLKIAGGVVLGLLAWNVIERYQQRRDIEEGMKELQRIAADPDPMGWRAEANRRQSADNTARSVSLKPIPPGFRCEAGTLLKRIEGGWMQVTDRHHEIYCPEGGTVDDCYRVSVQSTGCR